MQDLITKLLPPDRRPASLIDVGCGRGLYGAVAKTYWPWVACWGLDVNGAHFHHHVDAGTAASLWQAGYNYVTVDDAVAHLEHLRSAGLRHDIGLCLDMLEHLPRDAGEKLLELMPDISDNWILSTPCCEFSTGRDEPGGEHVSFWPAVELVARGWTVLQPTQDAGITWETLGWPLTLAYWGPVDLSGMRCLRVAAAPVPVAAATED